MKKICFITTSRADFGTLNELIKIFLKNKIFAVQLIISGSHTDNFFGNTQSEIVNKKKCKIKKIQVSSKNKDPKSVALSFADCVKKFTKELSELKPNIFIVFGDRYEMLAATTSAYILRIPTVHIAGGEKTIGSLDEGFRHSISKLSNLHFPIAKEYKNRLIQLGENHKTIFNYGSLNVTKIKKNKYLNKIKVEKKLKFKFYKKNLIVTFHPDTISADDNIKNLSTLLNSLKKIKNTLIIITSPNADAKGVLMISYIKNFIKKNKSKNFLFFNSLGSQIYLSILRIVDGVIGNSSSGISEAPFFGVGIVNIGDRQKGRIMFPNIINCDNTEKSISKSIQKILKKKYKKKMKNKLKIFGDGNAAKKIAKKILTFDFKSYEKKVFFDLKK